MTSAASPVTTSGRGGTSLVLLCHKASTGLRQTPTRPTRQSLKQRARQKLVRRGDRGGDMPFRPHRERPAA